MSSFCHKILIISNIFSIVYVKFQNIAKKQLLLFHFRLILFNNNINIRLSNQIFLTFLTINIQKLEYVQG